MINVEKLKKHFGPKVAVDEVSFSVNKGEVLGFLGPNGAGKSTSMRMITGYLPATSGKVTIGGFDIEEQTLEARRKIGYLPENAPVYSDMSVHGFLSFCAELRGLYGAARQSAVDRVVELCFLQNVYLQSVETLSKGFRHRTCLAQALLHDPEVLIMDEPTDGLDPNQKHEIRTLIRNMGADKAIVFSTHILEEVEAACTRALIIDQGKIVANGTPAELKARSPYAGTITIHLTNGASSQMVAEIGQLPAVAKVESLSESANETRLRVTPKGNAVPELVEIAGRQGWKIDHLQVDEGRLDDVFRAITMPGETRRAA